MIIGIDANSITKKFQNGTKRYANELIYALAKIDKKNTYILFASSKIRIPKQKNFKLVVFPGFPILKKQLFLPIMVRKYKVDVFHTIDPYGSIFMRGPKIVTTVHDLDLGVVYPTFKSLTLFLKRVYSEITRCFVFRNTDKFVAVSKTTLRDLAGYLTPEKIKKDTITIYESASNIFKNRSFKKSGQKYFLCMGDFSPRKNLKIVFKAFTLFSRNLNNSYKLYVIVSTGHEARRYKKIIGMYKLGSKVKIFVSPTDLKVADLYHSASAFLYPSFYEGFGLPILEAMSLGCPVITSNYGAMKEISGGSSILIDPKSETELEKAMVKIVSDPSIKNRLIKSGYSRSKLFSWQLTAKNVLEVYKSAYAKKLTRQELNRS